MSFFEAIAVGFKKYGTFSGTAGRPEFWWFALFTYLGAAALNALNLVTPQGTIYLGSSLSAVFGLAVLLPYLAVTVRRLRDCGRSWANLFWLLLPIAGLIILIVFLAQPGTSAQSPGRLPDNTVRA